MNNRYDILKELGEISPLLAEIPWHSGPYSLPAGYFDQLPDAVMVRLKASLPLSIDHTVEQDPPLLSQVPKPGLPPVPDHYFETFADKLMARIKAAEAATPGEELELIAPLLSSMPKDTPYRVPAGYFNELAGNVVGGLQAVDYVKDELADESSTLLGGLKDLPTFQLPEGYFDRLPQQILQRVQALAKPAKLITMSRSKSWMRYAAAAVMLGVILTIGIMQYNKQHPAVQDDPVASLSKISDQDIINYMEDQEVPASETIAQNNGAATAGAGTLDDLSDSDIRELMSDVSDSDLQQYAEDQLAAKELKTN